MRLKNLKWAVATFSLWFSAATYAQENHAVDVVIVGAGLSGLSTAYRLQKAGVSYEILEISPHIGGRIRTAQYADGTSAELGLEEFWEENPTLEIIKELGVQTEPSATSFSTFQYKGKTYPFIHETNTEFLKSLFNETELKAFKSWDQKTIELFRQAQKRPLTPEQTQLKNISFADWVKKEKNLTEKVREFIRIEVEPEFATSWNNISALDGIFEWHIFSGEGSHSWHILGGNQKLPEAIAKKIGLDHISLNTKVTQIESNSDGVKVIGIDQSTFKQKIVHAKFVVTTVPLYRLLEMQFVPPLSEKRKQAIRTQGWGAYFTAHVTLSQDAAKFFTMNGQSILPVLSDSPLGCVYGDLPEKKDSPILLNLLVNGASAEKFNARAASAMDEVRKELTEEFEKRWPGIQKFIQRFEFHQYHPRAIASWPVGRSRLDDLSDLMRTPQGRVYFAGDYTEGTHSDGAAHSAIRVTEGILKELKKK